MKTNHYDSNLIDLQFSIENNIEKWAMMPSSACNHVYNTLPKEKEKSGEDIVIQPNADKK